MPRPKKYTDELRERAVRLVFESQRPIAHVARDLGVHKEALRRHPAEVSAFIDQERERFCVELICDTLGVSVSVYYARRGSPPSARAIEDARLLTRIRELHAANYCAYGYRRMWKALGRTGEDVGRDRVKRLMAANDIQGAKRRGKPWRTAGPPRRIVRPISSSAPSARPGQTRSGWLISPTSRPTGEETRKRTGRNTDTAPRPDPYTYLRQVTMSASSFAESSPTAPVR